MTLSSCVCLKVVPKPEEVTLNPETKILDRTRAENVLNPADKNALEVALRLKEEYGGSVTVVAMGPPLSKHYLHLCLGMGADRALLLSDRAFVGSDTYPTTLILARAIGKAGKFDLILCGELSADAGTGQVPAGLAEWLNLPLITYVNDVAVEEGRVVARRALGPGYEVVSADIPALLSVVLGANTPRFPDFGLVPTAARAGQVEVWTAADLGLTEAEVGLKGSFTTVHDLVEGEPVERKRQIITGEVEEQVRVLSHVLRP